MQEDTKRTPIAKQENMGVLCDCGRLGFGPLVLAGKWAAPIPDHSKPLGWEDETTM